MFMGEKINFMDLVLGCRWMDGQLTHSSTFVVYRLIFLAFHNCLFRVVYFVEYNTFKPPFNIEGRNIKPSTLNEGSRIIRVIAMHFLGFCPCLLPNWYLLASSFSLLSAWAPFSTLPFSAVPLLLFVKSIKKYFRNLFMGRERMIWNDTPLLEPKDVSRMSYSDTHHV